jgi:hypothetical protein
LTSLLVVTRETMNTGFNKNQTVLGILVLAVAFKMFTDGDGLLDQVVQVFRNFGSETYKRERYLTTLRPLRK